MLDPQIQKSKHLPTWSPRSIPSVLTGNSREHVPNTCLAFILETNHVSSQFYLMFDDYFQTLTSFKNNLPPKWREVFAIDHCDDEQSFRSPLDAKVNNNKLKEKFVLIKILPMMRHMLIYLF